MNINHEPRVRTRMFARVIGPFVAAIAIIAALRGSEMTALLAQFTASAVWPWVTGAFVLLGGIAVVAFHQYWRSPAEVLVSVLGWMMVVRGVILIAFPAAFASMANRMIGWHAALTAVYVVMAVIGMYLTVIGYAASRSEEKGTVEAVAKHLRHAA